MRSAGSRKAELTEEGEEEEEEENADMAVVAAARKVSLCAAGMSERRECGRARMESTREKRRRERRGKERERKGKESKAKERSKSFATAVDSQREGQMCAMNRERDG